MDNKDYEGKEGYGKGYGKRPLWQWIVIYAVIGAIIYGLVYYFILAKPGSSNSAPATGQLQQQPAY